MVVHIEVALWNAIVDEQDLRTLDSRSIARAQQDVVGFNVHVQVTEVMERLKPLK
jgi:hypothetical protein